MHSTPFDTDAAPWRRALRHLVWALLAVLAIAVTVNLLALPVVHAQARPELRIGDQKSASLFVLQKAQGSLEKERAPLGFGVKWVEFPAGLQRLEGLNEGVVDVRPITPEVAADQQKIADTFFALKLIPKAIQVSDAVVFAQP